MGTGDRVASVQPGQLGATEPPYVIGLPIDSHLPQILAGLAAQGAVVVEASPGAGKTTRVPPALLERARGEIVVLEPRRLAARMAAARVAAEMGEAVGETVGYRVRFDSQVSKKTRLTFVTEGVLTRRLASDPTLAGVAAVVIDELHERHLQCDLAVALLSRLRRTTRPDLELVAMSATLDAAPVSALLGAAEIRCEARRFDVAIEHVPDREALDVRVASAVRALCKDGLDGHVLVFLPGIAEIRRAMERCAAVAKQYDLRVMPLHGSLRAEEQDAALAPSDRRKLIVATNVAETSLTIDGVAAVIDSGLVKVAVQHPWSTLPRLEQRLVCKASATQRAGRAGRTRDGRCLRLYAAHELERQPAYETPEIERSDLADVWLAIHVAGAERDVRWLSPPPDEALAAAERVLTAIDALKDGHITDTGRTLAALPVHPRLGRALLEARALGVADRACDALAALSEPSRGAEATDVWDRVAELRDARDRRFDRARRHLAGVSRALPRMKETDSGWLDEEQALMAALARGFPDRIAQRKKQHRVEQRGGAAKGEAELQLCEGGRARVAGTAPATCVVLDAELGRPGEPARVRLFAPLDGDVLLSTFIDDIVDESALELAGERVEQVSRLRYRELTIEEKRRRAEPSPEASALLLDALKAAGGLHKLGGDGVLRLASRLRFAGMAADLDALAREACEGMVSLSDLRDVGIEQLLLARVDRAALQRAAPDRLRIGGSEIEVSYPDDAPPFLETYLQDFFGMARGPVIGGTPVVLHLWAPNGRAVQVTGDLPSFWQAHYPTLRRELMRRYPKHHWPEDPLAARPVRLKRYLED